MEDLISPWDSFSAGELQQLLLCSPAEQGANLAAEQHLVVAASQPCCCSTGIPADTPCGSNASHTPKPQGLHSVGVGCTGAVGVGDHVQMMATTSVTHPRSSYTHVWSWTWWWVASCPSVAQVLAPHRSQPTGEKNSQSYMFHNEVPAQQNSGLNTQIQYTPVYPDRSRPGPRLN